MDKILIIVESPGKIKKIKSFLDDKYVVRASFGHIMDLASGRGKGMGVDIENDFTPTYVVIPDKKDKIKAITDAAKDSSLILLASDPDREGECISYHLKECLKSLKIPIKRITFNEITKRAVQEAVKKPGELNQELYSAQQARRVLDRLVGFLASPLLINKLGTKLSAGRVQSVCLRLIVEREREIESFIPEIYWDITANLSKNKDAFVAKYPKRITDEKLAAKIKSDLDASTFSVKDVKASEQKRNPPAPLITSKLQQTAASRFKFPAARTMKAAQALYERGLITYMRTDSTRCSPESIAAVREWIFDNGYEIPKSPNVFKTKDASQDAHEAIRPTDVAFRPDDFADGGDEEKIYRLIWEFFVASQMKPAVFDTVAVTIDASKGHELKANGRTLKYPGWLAILNIKDKDDEDATTLPHLVANDKLILVPPGIKSEKKQTNPPPRYNDGSIIKELEKRGIGRPSTYAAIIGKIVDRGYVNREKNIFIPTDLGRQITDELMQFFSFMNYDYTRSMEENLDKIAANKMSYLEAMHAFYPEFKKELEKAYGSAHKDSGHKCDKCGKTMRLKHSKYGFFITCEAYPECKNLIGVELDGDKVVIREKHQVIENIICPVCNTDGMIKRDGQFGPFYSCSKWPKCQGKRKVPFGKKCSDCGNELYLTIFKNEPILFCMGYPNCKHSEKPPADAKLNWFDPKKTQPKWPKKVTNVLKGKKKKAKSKSD